MSLIFLRRPAALVALAGLAAGCSSNGAGPSTSPQVNFNLAVGGAGTAGASLLGDTVTAGSDILVFDKVELVLRDIRFKRTDEAACNDDDDDHDANDDDSVSTASHDGDDDDGCEYYNAGPFLLDLPLNAGITRAFSVAVDTGTFDELRLKLHKPEDDGDPQDTQFLTQHPDFQGISIRASGTFNDVPFTYETDLSAQQRMDLVPPLVISGGLTSVDVTIQVDLAAWFVSNGVLVDPASALKGGPNENLVRDTIRASFRAFRDDDRDGEDDDHHDGDDDDDHGDHGGNSDDD